MSGNSFVARRRSVLGSLCVAAACVAASVVGCAIVEGTPRDESTDDSDTRAPLDLGAPCTTNDACTSQHCANGVCCESACDGPCMDCSDAGVCDATPEDDDACGQITCLVGASECLLYSPAITSQRCRGFAECKTVEDCTVEQRPRGTACILGTSSASICVDGECTYPTVLCAGSPCTVSPPLSTCCVPQDPSEGQAECGGDCALNAPGERDTAVFCDEHEDCRPGTRCALRSPQSGARFRTHCTDDPYQEDSTHKHYEVCDSPAMDLTSCSNGAACDVTYAVLEGWTFCRSD